MMMGLLLNKVDSEMFFFLSNFVIFLYNILLTKHHCTDNTLLTIRTVIGNICLVLAITVHYLQCFAYNIFLTCNFKGRGGSEKYPYNRILVPIRDSFQNIQWSNPLPLNFVLRVHCPLPRPTEASCVIPQSI